MLSGVKWDSCLIYLGAVIVNSRCDEEHLHHVDRVVGLLREVGVTLKLPTCLLFLKKVEYPGHESTPGHLDVLETHTRAFRGSTFPKTRTQVRSFIGMCNVFPRFVRNFSRVALHLTEPMGATAPVQEPPPTVAQEHTFQEL